MTDIPKRFHQYIASIGATLGAFALGTAIGWSSPVEGLIEEKLNVTSHHISWISSIMPIGAASAQVYVGLTLDLLGRKLSMLIISIPFVIGWLILTFANSLMEFYIGRFITGFCGGTFCITAPTYIGEIADKDVRGLLTVFFQLLLVIGILVSYILGEFNNLTILTLPLCAGPVALFTIVSFLPESPIALYKKGKIEQAENALRFFRGEDYDIAMELNEIDDYTKRNSDSLWGVLKSTACVKAFFMLLGMHIVQQLTGVNSVIFFAHKIFKKAGSSMSQGTSAIISAAVQVIVTTAAAALIDKTGRKVLWVVSLSMMGVCLLIIGLYFMILRIDAKSADSIRWLPLIVICVYLAGFSFGVGPLPWVMIGEFLPSVVKGYLSSFITCFNWLLVFGVTKSFPGLVETLGAETVFWFYAAVCGFGMAFVLLFVIETKNKTLEEIQMELSRLPS